MLGACSCVDLNLGLLPSFMDPHVWFCTSAMSFLLLMLYDSTWDQSGDAFAFISVLPIQDFLQPFDLKIIIIIIICLNRTAWRWFGIALNLHSAVCKMVILHSIKSSSLWAWKDTHMSSPLSFFPVVLKFSFQWSHSSMLGFNLVCYFFMLLWMGMFLWFLSWDAFHWCVELVLFCVLILYPVENIN